MTNPTTVNKLIAMHLSAMADAFTIQMEDPKAGSATFEERFAALVDIEYTTRKSNTLKRLIKTAAFEQPSAHIADIDYKSGRKLDKELIHRLATRIHYRIPERIHYRRYRQRQDVSGLCPGNGSLQAVHYKAQYVMAWIS